MMEKLVGRIQEKKFLEDALASPEAELIAIYGRRRIGKTFLIRSVYEKYIKFESIGVHNSTMQEQLEGFSFAWKFDFCLCIHGNSSKNITAFPFLISVANHLANGNLKGAATDIVEFGISKSPAAPYYYGGKLLKETFFGNSTMSKAYLDWDDQKNALINNFRYYRQQGNEDEVEKIQKQIIQIERGQAQILETLQERANSDK